MGCDDDDETCPPEASGNEGWHEGGGDDELWDFSRPRLTMRSHLRFTFSRIKTRMIQGQERIVHCKSSAS